MDWQGRLPAGISDEAWISCVCLFIFTSGSILGWGQAWRVFFFFAVECSYLSTKQSSIPCFLIQTLRNTSCWKVFLEKHLYQHFSKFSMTVVFSLALPGPGIVRTNEMRNQSCFIGKLLWKFKYVLPNIPYLLHTLCFRKGTVKITIILLPFLKISIFICLHIYLFKRALHCFPN